MTNAFQNLAMIVAADLGNGIGLNNDMPWHISEDLKRFKEITSGHTIVMGRKTWESLPKKPLPNRRNIVLTRDMGYNSNGAEVYNAVSTILNETRDEKKVFVIGGATVYEAFYPHVKMLYLTRINSRFETDTNIPFLNMEQWKEVKNSGMQTDYNSGLEYAFIDYERVK